MDAGIPDTQFRAETASVAIAQFRNNQLVNCTMDAVTINSDSGNKPDPAVTLDTTQLALLLMDDGKFAFDSPKGNAVLATNTSGKRSTSEVLLALAVGDRHVDPTAVLTDADLSKEIAAIKQESANAKQAAGEIAMTSCNIPDHTVLGTCVIADTFTAPTKASIAWRVSRFHFDVSTTVDSDAGMLACLQLGGKWTAPAKNDPAVVRERLHQHAAQMRELAGPRNREGR
jgi:hypothetical protein